MLYTIENNCLKVVVNSCGAELWSIKNNDGVEFLWQGDPSYWSDRSPVLFPYIGRMIDKRYSYKENVYPMNIHGFALNMDFQIISHKENELSLQLKSTKETKKQYPWNFIFNIKYQLMENRLQIIFNLKNNDSSEMLFAVGGHPGFRVLFVEGEKFEDYRLRFPNAEATERVIFTNECFVDHIEPYELPNGNCINLSHSLFDQDAIVLNNTGSNVILENINGNYSVTVTYPQMPYIGFWHTPELDAPYVCIEPWSSLPSAKGEKTVWDNQKDLLKLSAGKTYENEWCITIK